MRTCKICDVPVWTGFKVGDEYYCSEEHLHLDFTEEEYLSMYSDDGDHAYYSDWETQSCEVCSDEMKPEDVCHYTEGLLGSDPKKVYCCKTCAEEAYKAFAKKTYS